MRKLQLQEVPGEDTPTLVELPEDEVLDLNLEQLTFELQSIDQKIAASKPNMAAIEEYNRKQKVLHLSNI